MILEREMYLHLIVVMLIYAHFTLRKLECSKQTWFEYNSMG